MQFEINKSKEILSRTPDVLILLLTGISKDWTHNNEGLNTWSPFDIIGHLIHGEKTDWVPRAEIILSDSKNKTFIPFDRFAQEKESVGKELEDLLQEFSRLRKLNLKKLDDMNLVPDNLNETGVHPELGLSSLKELLSSWVVHDLGHIAQISRVMAKQYKSEVGPWKAYLSILK